MVACKKKALLARNSAGSAFFAKRKPPARPVVQETEKTRFFIEMKEEKTFGFLAWKSFNKYGAEGFQRAIGKPFGRLRRGETLCITGKAR